MCTTRRVREVFSTTFVATVCAGVCLYVVEAEFRGSRTPYSFGGFINRAESTTRKRGTVCTSRCFRVSIIATPISKSSIHRIVRSRAAVRGVRP